MLRIEHDLEASNYFLDNGKYTFALMVKIEGLVFTNQIPDEGRHREPSPGVHIWKILDHIVVYEIKHDQLTVQTVMPA